MINFAAKVARKNLGLPQSSILYNWELILPEELYRTLDELVFKAELKFSNTVLESDKKLRDIA
jgi:hypothetical protein